MNSIFQHFCTGFINPNKKLPLGFVRLLRFGRSRITTQTDSHGKTSQVFDRILILISIASRMLHHQLFCEWMTLVFSHSMIWLSLMQWSETNNFKFSWSSMEDCRNFAAETCQGKMINYTGLVSRTVELKLVVKLPTTTYANKGTERICLSMENKKKVKN